MTAATMSMRAKPDGLELALRAILVLMIGLGCVSFIEPSPYEMFFFLLIPIAIVNGLTITRTTLFVIVLMVLAMLAELLALMPHLDAPAIDDPLRPVVFSAYSVYLQGSVILFTMIFSRDTEARVSLALKAYGFSCVFAGIWGFLSYLNIAGIGEREAIVGRIAGPFKDPNVLGSYSVLGVVIFTQATIVGRHRLVSFVGLLVTLFGGVFLSFSRGSWGATCLAVLLLLTSMYLTSESIIRRRIRRGLAAIALILTVAGAVVASNDTLRSTITDRAKVEQDYDGGYTGRFGNQMRSIPMLMERPLGFGPHRFSVEFGLDPHNSYIGAFSAGGWIGGCVYILLVSCSVFLAVRLAFARSPFRRYGQVVGPAMFCLFLQAFQIDVDHWRFVVLMIGLTWGLEAARVRWLTANTREAAGERPLGVPAMA